MATSGPFKIPGAVAQDLALIIGFVDPPENSLHSQVKTVTGCNSEGSLNTVHESAIKSDDDIASSGTESENEVEAEIALIPGLEPESKVKCPASSKEVASAADSSDSDSSCSSSSVSSLQRRKRTNTRKPPPTIGPNVDEEDPSIVTAYIPSAHELPPTAIPVLPLPDPSILPQDPLELVGEIATVLPDSVIVRGSGPSGSGRQSAQERRDAALDEGSLLLFDDRTPLGYVWETFGPTSMPHYVVRIKRGDSIGHKSTIPHPAFCEHAEPAQGPKLQETEINDPRSALESKPATSLNTEGPDSAKLCVSRPVYHLPSLSNFVFPNALEKFKGSDASNIHDEEPAEHELEFSDDEAEAAHKRLRSRSLSEAPSHASSPAPLDDDAMSTIGDNASSLYGASPYDSEDVPSTRTVEHDVPLSPISTEGSYDSSLKFEDPAVRDALILARESRNRRPSSASMSDLTSVAGPSQPPEPEIPFSRRGHGRGRGRGRGKERGRPDRGRDRSSRNHARGRVQRVASQQRREQQYSLGQHHRSSFSFEEYDPHMPRPPSPTSLAIARATGQWADGTPFLYAGSFDASSTGSNQSPLPTPYGQTSYQDYQDYGHYEPTSNSSLKVERDTPELGVPSYGVAPHINPRFAQAFGLTDAPHPASVGTSMRLPPNSVDFSVSCPQPGVKPDPEPGSWSGE